MKIVFTKLTTPLNSIQVDHGDGRGFVNVPVASLEGPEQYIELDDNAVERSIRVKTSTEEIESFDMIKEYQITDDEGNILGGSCNGNSEIDISEVNFSLQSGCGGYSLFNSGNSYPKDGFINEYGSELYYLSDLPGFSYVSIRQYVAEEVVRSADGKILYLRAPAYTGYAYMPVPIRVKIVGK